MRLHPSHPSSTSTTSRSSTTRVALVLKGVSLGVPKGGIVALLGANGAGKTTTLKAISNLLHAERGEVTKGAILFDGERVDRLSPNDLVRRGAIQVMEGRHCFGHLTIEENLLTGAFTRRDGRAAVLRDLEAVYAYFPRLERAPPDSGGLHLGRRAADVRDRPGDDVEPEAHPARRAVDGPRAAGGRGDLRDRAGPERARRGVVPARRAEHQHRAALRAFRLYSGDRPRRARRRRRGAADPTRTCANSISASPARAGARSSTSRPTSAASAGWREDGGRRPRPHPGSAENTRSG